MYKPNLVDEISGEQLQKQCFYDSFDFEKSYSLTC